MKFAVASEHRDFFRINRSIEFDGLFSADLMRKLKAELDLALAVRLKIEVPRLSHEPTYKFFNAGRDLWRSQEQSPKIHALHRDLAKIAAELLEQRTVRLGYDQLFPSIPKNKLHPNFENSAFVQLYQKTCTLNEISCIQGVLCAVMLCLEGEEANHSPESEKSEAQEIQIFSKTAGNCVFFQPDVLLDFNTLCSDARRRHLLIVYANSRSAYILNEADPHGHALKHLGYTFGDPLSDKLNPILYR